MNRGQLRTNVRSNLSDAGVTYYDDQSINDCLQDAYNEVAAKCYCIVKSVTVNQLANINYYDFLGLGTTDYMGTIGIFNLATNFWLRDDVSLRDFDRLRRDWELWNGDAQFWAPHSFRRIAIAPKIALFVTQQFTVWYWASAPSFVNDSSVPLVASDMQQMLENYATGDLLDGAQEMTKAQSYWDLWKMDKDKYARRCWELAKADLLLRV